MSRTSTRRAAPSSGSLSRVTLPLPSSSSSSSSCRYRRPHHHLVTTLSSSSPRPTPPSQPHVTHHRDHHPRVRQVQVLHRQGAFGSGSATQN
ncbi:hypothetical protein Tco_0171253, partial [Tanacetum coccineum]